MALTLAGPVEARDIIGVDGHILDEDLLQMHQRRPVRVLHKLANWQEQSKGKEEGS